MTGANNNGWRRTEFVSAAWVIAESLPEFSYLQRLCEILYGKAPLTEPPEKYPVAIIFEKNCAAWSDRMDRAAKYQTFIDFVTRNHEPQDTA